MQEFQSPDLCVCPIHQCSLIDTCKICNDPLQFDSNLFNGFFINSTCHALLAPEQSSLPALTARQSRDCFGAAVFSQHFKQGKPKITLNVLRDVTAKIAFGYKILNDEYEGKRLVKSVCEYLGGKYSLPGMTPLVLNNMYNLVSRRDWPLFNNIQSFVCELNKSVKHTDIPETVFTSFSMLCSVFADDAELVSLLAENGLISSNGRLEQRSVVNIAKLLNEIKINKGKLLGINLLTFNSQNKGYHVEATQLIRGWLNDEVDAQFIPGTDRLEEAIIIDEEELKKWLIKNPTRAFRQIVSSAEAQKILGIPRKAFNKLKEENKLLSAQRGSKTLHRFEDVIDLKNKIVIADKQMPFSWS